MKRLKGLDYLKEQADTGDKQAEALLIQRYVEELMKPILPMVAMRVKLIMEEVFEQTRKRYESSSAVHVFPLNVIDM